MKHCILEDSSFVISTINRGDMFHYEAVKILNELVKRRDKIKIIIPSIVFFESIIKLIQRGVPPKYVEDKLWNFLYIEEVLNITFPETAAFRLIKHLQKADLKLKAPDLVIALTAIEYEAQILTFDKPMWSALQNINYSQVYFCPQQGEQKRFLKDLDKAIGLDIPF